MWPIYDLSSPKPWSYKEVTTSTFGCLTKTNTFVVLLFTFEVVWCFVHSRSDEEVTVDTFWCLTKINTLTVLLLLFDVVWKFDLFWPLRLLPHVRWRGHHGHFLMLTKINTLTGLLLSFDGYSTIWPYLAFDPFTVGRTKRSPWTPFDIWPQPTRWQCYFCLLRLFKIRPYCEKLTFDPCGLRWPLRSHKV